MVCVFGVWVVAYITGGESLLSVRFLRRGRGVGRRGRFGGLGRFERVTWGVLRVAKGSLGGFWLERKGHLGVWRGFGVYAPGYVFGGMGLEAEIGWGDAVRVLVAGLVFCGWEWF